jgi:mono/diheme cytochrome c family protein
MIRNIKVFVVVAFGVAVLGGCLRSAPARYSIAADKSYEASLFRQNCAICHGPEAEGKLLETGTKVPSLREGEFKFRTQDEIYNQISNGGNGMLPFRNQLSEREVRMMAAFVHDKLRAK